MRRLNALATAAVVAVSISVSAAATSTAAVAPVKYKSCAQLNVKYPHGVGLPGAKDHVASARDIPVKNFTVNSAVYNANKNLLDRDKDKIACEKR